MGKSGGAWELFEQIGDAIFQVGTPLGKFATNTWMWVALIVGLVLYFLYALLFAHPITWGYLLLVVAAIVGSYFIYVFVTHKAEEH